MFEFEVNIIGLWMSFREFQHQGKGQQKTYLVKENLSFS